MAKKEVSKRWVIMTNDVPHVIYFGTESQAEKLRTNIQNGFDLSHNKSPNYLHRRIYVHKIECPMTTTTRSKFDYSEMEKRVFTLRYERKEQKNRMFGKLYGITGRMADGSGPDFQNIHSGTNYFIPLKQFS